MQSRQNRNAMSFPTGPARDRARGLRSLLVVGASVLAATAAAALTEAPAPPAGGAPLPAATVDSSFAKAEQALGRGEVEKALGLYQQVPATSPVLTSALYGEGRCCAALGQTEQAIRLFREAQGQADTSRAGRAAAAGATDLLGRIYMDLGRSELARNAFHELAERCPDRQAYAAVQVARTYRNDGAWYDAFTALKPALQAGRSDQAYDLALDIYWNLDARAQRELSRLLKAHLAPTNRELTDNRSQ